ncbi:ABC transporter permease, partial [Mycobacterium tuberculosis]|nr:ABC transporter permease [Mycobacterium tuberculosis]
LLAVAALLAPLVYPGDPQAIVAQPLVPPLADPHWPLGTDRLGRDVAAELIHGARTSLLVGLAAAAAALVIGTLIGTLAGFAGGLVD